MKIFFGLVPIFAVIFALCFPVAYLNYARSEDQEMQTLRMSAAVDSAGEAAMLSCLESDDIYIDYKNDPSVRLSPKDAAYTFAAVLLLNCGMPASERNIAYVQSHVPVMVLAEADGYYLAEHLDTGDGEVNLIFGIKRPYTVDTNPDALGAGTLYGVNLAMKHWSAVSKATLALTEGEDYAALPFTQEQILQWINRDIDLTVNAALDRYALRYNLPQSQRFYLPLTPGSSGVRRVERPTLIVVVEGLSLDGISKYTYSAVNGIAVSNRRYVNGWIDVNGKRWYAYADEVGDMDSDVFLSPEDAAKAGYWPWMG